MLYFLESHKTKSQLLAALCTIGKATPGQKDLHIQLVDIARQVLKLANEPPHGKTNNVVSEQVRHKLTCAVPEAG